MLVIPAIIIEIDGKTQDGSALLEFQYQSYGVEKDLNVRDYLNGPQEWSIFEFCYLAVVFRLNATCGYNMCKLGLNAGFFL